MTLENTSQVLMGATQSSLKKGTEDFACDPATFLAGLAVRRNSSNLLSVTKNDGSWAGISLGQSASSNKNTTVLKAGDMVPVLLNDGFAKGIVTVTSYANLVLAGNDTLKVGATTFTFKASSYSAEGDVGAVTNNNTTAANLAAKINAHSVAKLAFHAVAVNAVVTITSLNIAADGEDIDLVYTDNGTATVGLTTDAVTFTGGCDYVVPGANVYFSDTDGKAGDPAGTTTVSNAIYASSVLTGIQEDGTTAYAAYVNMIGGL